MMGLVLKVLRASTDEAEDELCILTHVAAHAQLGAGLQDDAMMSMKPWVNLFHLTDVHKGRAVDSRKLFGV